MKIALTLLSILGAAWSLPAQGFYKFEELTAQQNMVGCDTASNIHIGSNAVHAVFPTVEVWLSWDDQLVGLTTYEADGNPFLQVVTAAISQNGLRYYAVLDESCWLELDARRGILFLHQNCQTLAFANQWP